MYNRSGVLTHTHTEGFPCLDASRVSSFSQHTEWYEKKDLRQEREQSVIHCCACIEFVTEKRCRFTGKITPLVAA